MAGSFTWADPHAEQPAAQGQVAGTEAVTVGISGWELVISIETLSIVRSRDCIAGLAARPREEGDLRRVNVIGNAVHARLGHVEAGAVSGDGEGCTLVKHRGGVAQVVDGHCSGRTRVSCGHCGVLENKGMALGQTLCSIFTVCSAPDVGPEGTGTGVVGAGVVRG